MRSAAANSRQQQRSLDFESYGREAFRPALDGLRAISAVLVMTNHLSGSDLGGTLNGWVGVWIFFAISGYLITMLLYREEAATGGINFKGFLQRRAFRILPLYYAVLITYGVLVMLPSFAGMRSDYFSYLPFFSTMNSEFIRLVWPNPGSVFGHSWTLGIEEKFYLLFPIAFFVILASRRTLRIVLCLMAFTLLLAVGGKIVMSYVALLLGAMLAAALQQRWGFEQLARYTRVPGWLIASALISIPFAPNAIRAANLSENLMFAAVILLSTFVLANVIIHRNWVHHVLATPVLRYVGRRSYAVYLIHVLAIHAVQLALPAQLGAGVILVAAIGVSLVGAEIMYRLIERPAILFGRRLSSPRPIVVAPAAAGG